MSVYTAVSLDQLAGFLKKYDIGEALALRGISDGIENTNYYLSTARGKYVLTLFETLRLSELPYFLDLMAFFSERGIPSARPVADRRGGYLNELNGKPAAIVHRLEGASVKSPGPRHCAEVGRCLGRLHIQAPGFSLRRAPQRDRAWWREMRRRVSPMLPARDRRLLQEELTYQDRHDFRDAPSGVIHADLFRDNVLFRGNTLTGILDFYYACNWPFVYDLAVALNDWCNAGADYRESTAALMGGYLEERQLSRRELELLPSVLRAAALRFWLSRLEDKFFPRCGEMTHIKNPDEFRDILRRNIRLSEEGPGALWPAPAA
ncbi:MAG: homoserine kinase [Gammaproteobacteria bacterium]|nr:homoserine kinase [Gammaproteobacteria bacterium]